MILSTAWGLRSRSGGLAERPTLPADSPRRRLWFTCAVKWTWPAVAIVVLALLAVPAVASAQVYCVNEPACPVGGINEGSTAEALQKALDAAETISGSTVIVGAGHYQLPGSEGFSYDSPHPVTIDGAGEGSTVLTTGAKPAGPVLNLFDSPATVSGMTVEIPPGKDLLGINMNAATLERIAVVGTGGEVLDEGVKMDGGKFRNGSIDMSKDSGESVVGVNIGGGEVLDSTIVSFEGIRSSSSGTVAVRGTRVSAVNGIELEGNATIEDTLVDSRDAENARAIGVAATHKLNATATLRALTIVNGGKEAVGVVLVGDEAKQTATLADSAIFGFAIPIETEEGGAGDGQSTTTSYSSYEAADVVATGGAPLPTDENPVAGGPAFAKPLFTEGGFAEANWSLSFNSPLIDAGTPGPLAVGEATTDLAGNPRVVNGRRDVGAYEFQRAAPIVSASASATTVALGVQVSFSGSASTPEAVAGDAIAGYQWTFDDGAVVPAGPSAIHAFASLGAHTATLSAGDLLGVLGAAAVRVTVGPHVSPCTCRPAGSFLTLLRLSPASFHAAQSGPSVARKHVGSRVSFDLSRAGKLTFTVERAASGIVHGRSCIAPRRGRHGRRCTRYTRVHGLFKRDGKGGANSFRFSGRIAARRLVPGRYLLVAAVAGSAQAPVSAAFRILG